MKHNLEYITDAANHSVRLECEVTKTLFYSDNGYPLYRVSILANGWIVVSHDCLSADIYRSTKYLTESTRRFLLAMNHPSQYTGPFAYLAQHSTVK